MVFRLLVLTTFVCVTLADVVYPKVDCTQDGLSFLNDSQGLKTKYSYIFYNYALKIEEKKKQR
ncbi:hypothetical protein Avbf_11827 [Armadillidium vulgare]|nr:hypothetical protein Avbf_11827 [Armadillidium vulgare]